MDLKIKLNRRLVFRVGFICILLVLVGISDATHADTVTVAPSGDESGVTDHANISKAFSTVDTGDTIELSEGTFYLSSSIIVTDFDGVLKGAGPGATTLRTAPGRAFDVSPILDATEWIPPARGHPVSMLLFLYTPGSTQERTFRLSDMKIVVDQPAVDGDLDGYVDHRVPHLLNTMFAVIVSNPDMLNLMLERDYELISLDASFEDVVVDGARHPKFHGFWDGKPLDLDHSMFGGIQAWGPANGKVEATRVSVTNAGVAINLSDFTEVAYRDCTIQSALIGFETFDSRTTATNNRFIDSFRTMLLINTDLEGNRVENNSMTLDPAAFAGRRPSEGGLRKVTDGEFEYWVSK